MQKALCETGSESAKALLERIRKSVMFCWNILFFLLSLELYQ